MGDLFVLSILLIISILIVLSMVKKKKKGIPIACSSCHIVKSCNQQSCELPQWVSEYRQHVND